MAVVARAEGTNWTGDQWALNEVMVEKGTRHRVVRLMVMLGVTLGVGLLLAGFTIRRTLHLEKELQKRYEEGVRARLLALRAPRMLRMTPFNP